MNKENRKKALSGTSAFKWAAGATVRIQGSQQHKVRKDLATMNVDALFRRSKEVVQMCSKGERQILNDKKLGIGAKEPKYTVVRKSTRFGGTEQRRAEAELGSW